jgi:hypothetical protein
MANIGAVQPMAQQQAAPAFQQGFAQLLQGHTGQAPIQVVIPPQPGDPNFVMPQQGQPGQQAPPPVNPGGAL